MRPKYSHIKKRSATGLLRPGASTSSNLIKEEYDPNGTHNPTAPHIQQYHHHIQLSGNHFPLLGIQPNTVIPTLDPAVSQAMTAVAHLERAIARLLLVRFEWDITRLYSTRLYWVSVIHIPVLAARLAEKGGPGWVAMNADSEDIKDFFRSVIGMDMREAGERVATKSVLWSYTALRRFALAHNVPVDVERGLQSLRLLPHYTDLKDHLDSLEDQPSLIFEKPTFLGGLEQGFRLLEETCVSLGMDLGIDPGRDFDPMIPYLDEAGQWIGEGDLSSMSGSTSTASTGMETRIKLRMGYARLVQTLWRVAREFDIRGYGQVLREKLTVKWCECGCSTDHLGEVCERTVQEEEEEREKDGSGIWAGGDLTAAAYAPAVVNESIPIPPVARGKSSGKKKATNQPPRSIDADDREKIYARLKIIKEKEMDGRGSGVFGWQSKREEDTWEVELDFGAGKNNRGRSRPSTEMGDDDEVLSPQPSQGTKAIKAKQTEKKKSVKIATTTPSGLVTVKEVGDGNEEEKKPSQKVKLDPASQAEYDSYADEEAQMTIGELMEWRFIKAEAQKELGNTAFRKGEYQAAAEFYKSAFQMEPEMPRYQLNLASAYLKIENWIEAEQACTNALAQHRSSKGLFRRAKARKEQGKIDDAISDYRALIRLQPHNISAMIELLLLLYPSSDPPQDSIDLNNNPWNVNLRPQTDRDVTALYEKLGITRPKRQKPLPFERSPADDIKLKIVHMPSNNDGLQHQHQPDTSLSDGGTENDGVGKGKLKSGKVRGKEKREEGGGSGIISGTAADYGIAVFAWDRYLVQTAA